MLVRSMLVVMLLGSTVRVAMRCPMTAPTSTSWLPTSAAWLPTPTPASTCKGEGEPPRVIGVGISDGDHVVLNVSPLALTGGAEIIVAADKALVACAIDGPTTSIADHTRVECTLLLLGLLLLGVSTRLLLWLPLPLSLLHLLIITFQSGWLFSRRPSEGETRGSSVALLEVNAEDGAIELVEGIH